MRLSDVAVEGLFGIFTHRIPTSKNHDVTIVHGPNGFGKTVLLRMVAAVARGRFDELARIPFETFRIGFSNGWEVVVRGRPEAKPESNEVSGLSYSLFDELGHAVTTEPIPRFSEVPDSVLERVDRFLPPSLRRFEKGWRTRGGRLLSLPEVLRAFPRAESVVPQSFRRHSIFPAGAPFDVLFIESRRLDAERSSLEVDQREYVTFGEPRYAVSALADLEPDALRVEQYSSDISKRLKLTLAEYANTAQQLDQTLPRRLVDFLREKLTPLSSGEILKRIQDAEARRQRLIRLGILDQKLGDILQLTEPDLARASEALTIYVDDIQRKLDVFRDLETRAGTMIDILNGLFRYKRIRIDPDAGFVAEADSGSRLQLRDLSSGEQHELVLLYELCFRTPAGSLLLIDEPEISLHVAWQARFLEDLMKVLSLSSGQALIATHSPFIIGERWDLTVELKGPAEPEGSQR